MAGVRRRGWRMGALLALAAGAGFLLHVALWHPFAVVGEAPEDGFTRVAGVVHVHTTASDGGGTPEEVIAGARQAGLAFVGITDHNVLDAKPLEGYHDGVLVLVGTEISTTAGHLLALGLPDPVFRFSGDAADALDDVRALGGYAFAAHPTSSQPAFRWTGWDLPGPWGMELLNGDSQWRAAGWRRLAATVGLYGLNRPYALLGSLTPPDAALERWDALLAERDVAGIAGADAHSRVPIRKRLALRFPSYRWLFGLLQNHVLLEAPLSGNAAADSRAVLAALAGGRSYVGLDALAPARGFSFAASAGGRRWTMGETVAPVTGLQLRAGGTLPAAARLTLLKDGTAIAWGQGSVEAAATGAGVYRVEVHLPGWSVPWILSNPIYVFEASAAAERARRAAWPPAPEPPAAAATLDALDGRTIFAPEFDPSSSVDPAVFDARGGPGGRAAARMAFRLGAPGPGRPYTWCALVNRAPRDLTGRNGLVFSIKGDGVYRVWVQVRDENPASADEGTEWWFASVRTSPEWRRVAVPFARLRSLNKATDGRLDLDRVRALAFVLDGGAVKVGTRGALWVSSLGVY